MLQLINRFVDICLLRRGPQDLPASGLLAGSCVAVYALLVYGAEQVLGKPERAFQWSALALVVMLLTVYGLLAARRVRERFSQTLSALAGCGAIYLLIYLPLSAALTSEPGQASGFAGLLFFAWTVVFFWGFLIEGSIYRHALNLSLPAGVLISVLLFAAITMLYRGLFGVEP